MEKESGISASQKEDAEEKAALIKNDEKIGGEEKPIAALTESIKTPDKQDVKEVECMEFDEEFVEKNIIDRISNYSQELAKDPQMFQEWKIPKFPPNQEKMEAAIGIINLEVMLMVHGKSDFVSRVLSEEDFEHIVVRWREEIDDENWVDIKMAIFEPLVKHWTDLMQSIWTMY